MNRPVISIIVATYNAELTLPKFLECIVPQKSEDVELIVVDGKSTDGTYAIVKTSKVIDYSISEKDKGIYDAWNKGIRMAHGDWIMFVGSDDELLPNVLDNYAKFAKTVSNDVDIITAQSEFVDMNNKLIKIIGSPFSWSEYRRNMEIAHGTTLHRKTLFDEIGFYDIKYHICADYELFMRKGPSLKCVFYNHTLMRFKIGGASFSYRCQAETFAIRKRYKTVSILLNLYLAFRRCVGITIKRMRYRTY